MIPHDIAQRLDAAFEEAHELQIAAQELRRFRDELARAEQLCRDGLRQSLPRMPRD